MRLFNADRALIGSEDHLCAAYEAALRVAIHLLVGCHVVEVWNRQHLVFRIPRRYLTVSKHGGPPPVSVSPPPDIGRDAEF